MVRAATRRCEIRPALQFESLTETMFSLAADGLTNVNGMPNPFRLAVIVRAHFAPSDNRPNGLVRGRRSGLECLRWRRLRTIGARHATDRLIGGPHRWPVAAVRTRSVASPTSTYSNLKPSGTSCSESQERLHEGRRPLVVPGRGPGRTGLTWRIRRGSLSGDRRVSHVRLLCGAAGEADGLPAGGLAM